MNDWILYEETDDNKLSILSNGNLWYDLIYVNGVGYVGLCRYIFTVGLCFGVSPNYNHAQNQQRFCYKNMADAKEAINKLRKVKHMSPKDIIPDDEHWIKGKGLFFGEIRNKNKTYE